MNKKQVKGLKAAAAAYNNGGKAFSFKANGKKIHVKFKVGVAKAENKEDAVKKATHDYVDTADGGAASYGNTVGLSGRSSDEHLGNSSRHSVNLNPEKIASFITKHPGGREGELIRSAFIHEIGHNIGGSHGDPGSIMKNLKANPIIKRNTIGDGRTGKYRYTTNSVTKHAVRAIVGRINMSPGSINSNYLSDKENKKVNESKNPGSTGRIKKIK